MGCSLCGSIDCRTSEGTRLLICTTDIRTLAFLRGYKAPEGDGDQIVCQNCYAKIQIVSELQKKFLDNDDNGVDQTEARRAQRVERLGEEEEEEQEESDCNYDELNQLSTFCVENDDVDPEYDPRSDLKSSYSSIRVKKISTRQGWKIRNDSSMSCQLCSSTLRRVATLRRHYISRHEYNPALTAIQEEKDKQETDKRLEGEEVQKETYTFRCKECPETFCNKHNFIKHVLHHVGGGLPLFKCKKCSKSYRHERDLKTHQERLCQSLMGQSQVCRFCHKSYIISRIKTHQSYVHQCRFCDHISKSRADKTRHLSDKHSDEMEDVCAECGDRFETSKCLLKHQRTTHAKNFVQCPKKGCRQTFAKGSSRFKRHLQRYHNPQSEALRASYQHQCKQCLKRVKTKALLRCHMSVKHNSGGAKAKCPFCDYSVPMKRRSDIYRYHIRRTHPEREEEIAAERNRLWRKKEDHQLRAKVQCFLCSYAATKASNMTRHYTEVHEYDKDLADKMKPDPENPDGALCPECGEHFPNRHVQIKHLLKVHSRSGGEQCLYCNYRYLNIESHITSVHQVEKNATIQFCSKCTPEQNFSSFEDLLRHTRSYHRKKPDSRCATTVSSASRKKAKASKVPDVKSCLCENCGKTIAAQFMARHRSECPQIIASLGGVETPRVSKRYIPVHLSGICPYCELKFSDLLGHLRIGHEKEKKSQGTVCALCSKRFGSVRELVSHRQLHPKFKNHTCLKCRAEFETVVELRHHRVELCPKRKKQKAVVPSNNPSTGGPLEITIVPQQSITNSPSANDYTGQTNSFKPKPIDYEGRGTVSCHICSRPFTMKVLLRRHYQSHHEYKAELTTTSCSSEEEQLPCNSCNEKCLNRNAWIKHKLDYHTIISGQVCPYCDSKWGPKKFDSLDEHVHKHHFWEMQSPIQQCSTCKMQFGTYEELKEHRQIHDKQAMELNDVNHGANGVVVHSRVGAIADIGNRGGVNCLLCNVFKLRKDHLKTHYIKHHGYDPKLAVDKEEEAEAPENLQDEEMLDEAVSCPSCHKFFQSNHSLIKHLLKHHCNYTGLICPYCKGHHPERYIDLQGHVTQKHIDQLTGYNIDNSCKVCKEKFSGYAELRDHVQVHGNAYRDPYGNPEAYKEYARRRRRLHGKITPFHKLSDADAQALEDLDLGNENAETMEDDVDLHNASISSLLFKEIFAVGDGEAEAARNALALEEATGSLLLADDKSSEETELFEDIIAAAAAPVH